MDDTSGASPKAKASGERMSFASLQGEVKKDAEAIENWREHARRWYGLYANNQWPDEHRAAMEKDGRPAVSMNRIQRNIQAVAGHEVSNRQEIRCIPREMGDVQVSEVATSGIKWFREEADAEDEESTAFVDNLIAGMGWTETGLDHDLDPDGAPVDIRVDPMEMVPDRHATRANLVDARRVSRIRRMPASAAREMFPDADLKSIDAAWARGYTEEDLKARDRDAPAYEGGADDEKAEGAEITVVECQWIEREPYYRVVEPVMEPVMVPVPNPMTGQPEPQPMPGPDGQPMMQQVGEQLVDMSPEEFEAAGRPEQHQKARRICRYRAFLGAEDFIDPPVRMEGPDPANPEKMKACPRFTYQAMTGNWDSRNRFWFGLVAPMEDPQNWANKLYSQILHIINVNAKGGIMAELGAFDNQREAEESWAKADRITWLANNAMAQQRIMPKPQATYPQGMDRMMVLAFENIGEATGISQELLGLRDAAQAGVLEAQRTQRGLTILARYFDSLRRFRKNKGEIYVYILQTQIPDGRMVRIVGSEQEQYVPLLKQELSGTYDIIIDETPTSPSVKDRTWGMLAPLFEKLPPPVQMELLDYSPLPESAVQRVRKAAKEAMEQSQNQPDPKVEAAKAQFELEQQKFQLGMQMKQAEFDAEQQRQAAKMAAETQMKREQMALDQQLARERAAFEAQLARQKMDDEFSLKAYQAELSAQVEASRPAPPVQ